MKAQWIFGLVAVLVFCILYWGFDTKSSEQKGLEKSRARKFKIVDITVVERDARAELPPEGRNLLEGLDYQLRQSESESDKAELLKKISGYWYGVSQPAIAGEYARKVAEIEKTDQSWSIAGTTFTYGLSTYEDSRLREYCAEEARAALEKAVSINPENTDHRINLALTYVEMPPEDNPMRGILMLLDLNKKEPENVNVLLQLAQLGLQTGQFEKAKERLEKANQIDPENNRVICLLAEVYKNLGDQSNARTFEEKCDK